MKTAIDIVDELYSLLDGIPVDVFADVRPDDHKTECIVLKSLPITGAQLQTGIVNVNIHVPNLKTTIQNQPSKSIPNRIRIKEIADQVTSIIEDAAINNTVTGIENITLLGEPDLNEHFLNIRVRINSANLK